MNTGGGWPDPVSREALYRRVIEALEHSAELADQHAQRQQLAGRPRDAALESERARRARRIVARARAMLR
jgi:hypothetical protein